MTNAETTTQTETYAERIEKILAPYQDGTRGQLLADLAAAACEYEHHHRTGQDSEAAEWLARYQELADELGLDPLA